VAALRQDGHSIRAIAGALGVSKGAIQNDVENSRVLASTRDLNRVTGKDGKRYPRAIAGALGVSQPLISADIKASGDKDLSPDRVEGRDGRWYPARRVSPSRRHNAVRDATKGEW
jgi:hypothetical protein